MPFSNDDKPFSMWLACVILLFIAFMMIRGIFVEESVAIKAMEDHGFSDAKVIEKHWFVVGFHGGSRGDAAVFTVKATNPAGKNVEMYVSAGWPFKGATVRSK